MMTCAPFKQGGLYVDPQNNPPTITTDSFKHVAFRTLQTDKDSLLIQKTA